MAVRLQIGDIKNSYANLERSLRGIDGMAQVLKESEFGIKSGHPGECVKVLRLLVFTTARDLANHMVARGCSSTSGDKKVVLITFDFLREMKINPIISTEQFLSKVAFIITVLPLSTEIDVAGPCRNQDCNTD